MTIRKWHHATRKLSQRFIPHGYNISHSTVHRYLRGNRGNGGKTVKTQQEAEVGREAAKKLSKVRVRPQGLVSGGLEKSAVIGRVAL